jgi:hypothetical protein
LTTPSSLSRGTLRLLTSMGIVEVIFSLQLPGQQIPNH